MVLTLLVENHDVATGKVDGVSGRQTRNCNGESQQTDGQTQISSRCRASARIVREDEKEQRHKEQAGDDAIWGYLRPPPTTITLGAIIVTCGSFEGVDEGRKKDGARRKRKGGVYRWMERKGREWRMKRGKEENQDQIAVRLWSLRIREWMGMSSTPRAVVSRGNLGVGKPPEQVLRNLAAYLYLCSVAAARLLLVVSGGVGGRQPTEAWGRGRRRVAVHWLYSPGLAFIRKQQLQEAAPLSIL